MDGDIGGRAPSTLVDIPFAVGGHAPIQFPIDVRGEGPACFALSIRKSGSSLFSNLVTAIAQANGRHVVDIPATAFKRNVRYVDWNGSGALMRLIWRGNVYVGFRDMPSVLADDPIFNESAKILLVRDPRDALVSEFYSNAYSHSLPELAAAESVIALQRKEARASSIADYVVARVEALNNTMRQYLLVLEDPKLKVMRYEDVIFEKADWIRAIAKHFGMTASDGLVEGILGWADVRPDAESPTRFIRRVAPGDHREKLSPETLALVESKLSNFWWDFGYQPSGA